ncbi:MAG: peptidylprolyl isomerase [Cyanobacterium sp. T60_A2020_053]|nr:peptidylprolyl isomerase [Cyanobacterium sp. T60_A2020_053]
MASYLQVGEQKITEENLLNLLAGKQMLIPLAKELILDSALADIQCTEAEKTSARQQFAMQMGVNLEDSQQLETWLSRNYLKASQLQERIERVVKIEKFKQETWENQLESYFLKRKRQLDKIMYSLIRTKNAGTAQELYFRINDDGKDFAQIAREFSEGAEANTGGLIGPVELNVPHPQIAQALATAQPGKVLPPMRVGEWVVILRLEKYLSAQLDQNMKRRLLDELFEQWLQEKLQREINFHRED